MQKKKQTNNNNNKQQKSVEQFQNRSISYSH